MVKVLRCECGWETRGTDDEIVEAASKHGWEVHNMELTRDQVLALAKPVEA